jgi:tRNA(adenine34) deaminase
MANSGIEEIMMIWDFFQINRKGVANQGSFPSQASFLPFFLDKMQESDIKKMNFSQEIESFRQTVPLKVTNFSCQERSSRDGDSAIDLRPAYSEDERFMNMALEEARRAGEEGEVPVGAVLISAGQVIARSHNRPIALSDPTAHAEILALREGAVRVGNYRLPDSTIYVTIEPCTMCAGALLQARVRRLVFGAEDPKAGGVRSLYFLLEDERLNHRVEVTAGVLLEESREMLRRFFQERR